MDLKNLNGSRVLITGGCGFIGSHITERCVELGMNVHVVDNHQKNQTRMALYYDLDISNRDAMLGVFDSIKPDYVIHTAALARIQPSFEDPGRYFEVNAIGTYNILIASQKIGVKRIVYSASSSAYGDQPTLPLTEDMLIESQALHPYGSTKRMGEMLCRDFSHKGVSTVCLRYFNVYGPRQSTTADGPYATVIGIFLDQYKDKVPLTIVPDGYQKRDFTHVDDVVDANLRALLSKEVGRGEIINIGAATNYSIFETAALIIGKDIKEFKDGKDFIFALERKGEVRETLAEITKAKALLGWEPKVAFEEGIRDLKETLE